MSNIPFDDLKILVVTLFPFSVPKRKQEKQLKGFHRYMYLELEWNTSSGCLKAAFLFSTDNNGTVEHFSPDEHVKKVDEGKLDESSEDGHEAHDDKDVKGSRICNLHCGFENIFFRSCLEFLSHQF